MKHLYRYSPLPPSSYWLPGCQHCEVRVLMGNQQASALWNLFWLSNPGIDAVPEHQRDWHRHYRPVQGMLSSVTRDVNVDVVLSAKLDMHPETFIEWFEREDHGIYECYQRFGKPWVDTVLNRAEAAVLRMLKERPPVVLSGGLVTIQPHLLN